MAPDPSPQAPLEEWARRGGHWQVVVSTPERTTVALLTCDGGEEMERVEVDGPALHRWLARRTSSAD